MGPQMGPEMFDQFKRGITNKFNMYTGQFGAESIIQSDPDL